MKTYILGSGGIGGYFGGKLAQAGADVTFVARGEHYQAMKAHGLALRTTDGNFVINPVNVINSIGQIENPDLIILAVKAYDLDDVAKQLATVITKNTVILTTQNGITGDLIINEILPNTIILAGVAYIITAKTAPGEITQSGGLKKIIVGDRSQSHEQALENVVKELQDAGINAVKSEDIVKDMWQKFIFISAFSGMTALCRSSIGPIRENALTRDLYEKCVNEAINVAKSLDVALPETIFEDVMKITDATQADAKSSLLHDVENGKQTEIIALNGTLCRLAIEQGIDTPVNQMIFSVLQL